MESRPRTGLLSGPPRGAVGRGQPGAPGGRAAAAARTAPSRSRSPALLSSLPTLRPGGLFASRNAIHQKQGKKTNFLFPSPSLTPLLPLQETAEEMGCSEHFAGGRSIYRPAERAGRTMSRTSSAWSGLFQFAQLCSVRARGV